MISVKRILCPTDFSDHASHALEFALTLAGSYESSLWLVNVLEPAVLFGAELTSSALVKEVVKTQREKAQVGLARALERCVAAGISASSQLEVGPPALVLIELSNEADLVVMGTRGRTGFQRLLLGSVAERVVRFAKCPVVVVPMEHDRECAARDLEAGGASV